MVGTGPILPQIAGAGPAASPAVHGSDRDPGSAGCVTMRNRDAPVRSGTLRHGDRVEVHRPFPTDDDRGPARIARGPCRVYRV